jgi:hypothetical protein
MRFGKKPALLDLKSPPQYVEFSAVLKKGLTLLFALDRN